VFAYRRRNRVEGFDRDEAANYVWGHLTRDQRQRIALGHVVAVLEAELSAPEGTGEAELRSLVHDAAESHGARLEEADVEAILSLQVRYAEAKGLL
jgi:hypothetical protein